MKVLVTGGAGYIGTHTLVELLSQGHEALVVDDLSNGSQAALARVAQITNRVPGFARIDVRDRDALARAAADFAPDAAIHFAGLKAVGESAERPLDYHDVNVAGTVALLAALDAAGCRHVVFSSSATVYGEPQRLPADEDHPLGPTNVYGRTKWLAELVIGDWARAGREGGRRATLLRYFNPVGAHASHRIGEHPQGEPQNLMPYVAQVATGRRAALRIFGDDYPTPDGTGIRDYIHVADLAAAHVAALAATHDGTRAYNVGTGRGTSVREMVAAFERVTGRPLPVEVHPRRPGDIAEITADCTRAARELGWRATRGVDDMVADLWAFARANPDGY